MGMKTVFGIFVSSMMCTVARAAVTHDQKIISSDSVASQFFSNDLAAYDDWLLVGTAASKVHFMKWDGSAYDDTNRQVITGTGHFGNRVSMRGGWAFVQGVNQETQVYSLSGGTTWVFDSTIPYGRELSRYPDTHIFQARALDFTDDVSKIVIIDDVSDSYRIYEYTTSWAQLGSTVSLGLNPITCAMSGDGSRIVVCDSETECEVYDAATGTLIVTIDKDSFGAPYSSHTSPVGVGVDMNTDGSMIVVSQNSYIEAGGHVHFLQESTPNVWGVVHTVTDVDEVASYDSLGSDIQYNVENDFWMIADGLHSAPGVTRVGAVDIYRVDPTGAFVVETDILPVDDIPVDSLASKNFASGGFAYVDGRFISGTKFWDEPTLQNNDDGRVDVFLVPITGYPTASPTGAPSSAPTPNPRVSVGEVSITMSYTNSTKSQESAARLITDIKVEYPETDYVISGTDTFELPADIVQGSGATNPELIQAIKDSRNLTNCVVTLFSPTRRLLMDGGRALQATIVVEIVFELDEAAYDELQSSGNTLESDEFLAALALDLGVAESALDVVVVGSDVIVEVTLIAISSEAAPLDSDAVESLQALEVASTDAANTIVTEIGGGAVSVAEVDLCATRTCSGRGVFTTGVTTTEGCVIDTGVCACSGEFWGINCETVCSCLNDGVCADSYCTCAYPYFGVRCGSDRSVECNSECTA